MSIWIIDRDCIRTNNDDSFDIDTATVLIPTTTIAPAANSCTTTTTASPDANGEGFALAYATEKFAIASPSFCQPLFLSSQSHQIQILSSRDPTTIWIHSIFLLYQVHLSSKKSAADDDVIDNKTSAANDDWYLQRRLLRLLLPFFQYTPI